MDTDRVGRGMSDPTPLSHLLDEHPLVLPYCTDPDCCDPAERDEVRALKAEHDVAAVAPLLDRVGVCPLCLRNGGHSIHCVRARTQHTPTDRGGHHAH